MANKMTVELKWREALSAELQAPNGDVLLAILTPELARMIHREEGAIVLFSKPSESMEQSKRLALSYAKGWLAGSVGAEAVYGKDVAALSPSLLLAHLESEE